MASRAPISLCGRSKKPKTFSTTAIVVSVESLSVFSDVPDFVISIGDGFSTGAAGFRVEVGGGSGAGGVGEKKGGY